MRPKPKVRKQQGKALGLCPFSNKTMYLTKEDALKGLTLIWGSDPSVKLEDMHVYNNCACGKWHVGHIGSYQKYQEQKNGRNQMPDLRGQTVPN